jgi:hypothetical protein
MVVKLFEKGVGVINEIAAITTISNPGSDDNFPSEKAVRDFLTGLAIAAFPAHYERSRMWANKGSNSAANRRTLVSPDFMTVNINNVGYILSEAVELDLNVAGSWDTTSGTDYTVAANRAGKQFYVYACVPGSGYVPIILLSASLTYPVGYSTTTSRKIGSLHCECAAILNSALTGWVQDTVIALGETRKAVAVPDGYMYRCVARAGDFKTHATTEPVWSGISVGATIVDDQITWIKEQHRLEGYLAGDILPRSVMDLRHRPGGWDGAFIPGMVWNGKTDFDSYDGPKIWVAIYLASGTEASTASVNGGSISDSRNWMDFVDDFGSIGCRLPNDAEFQSLAAGSNEETNITGSADPVTTGGHVDTAARRMVSNIGCEDCCGVLYQWLVDQSYMQDSADAWGWYDLPGGKGSLYNQDGAVGKADVKLLAGGHWGNGVPCGSRGRDAYNSRWYAASHVGGRFVAEP